MLGRTSAVLIKGAVTCLADHLRILGWNLHAALCRAYGPLPEALAAGFAGMLRVIARHLDIVLSAALLLIVETASYRTIQSCHRTLTSC